MTDAPASHHRLGRLRLAAFASAVRDRQVALTDVHEEPEPPEAERDLRDAVRATRDEAWVHEIHDVLASHDAASLLACAHTPGDDGMTLVLAADLASHADVGPGDTVVAGFAALREGDAEVQVWPRHIRCVCANGTVLPTAYGEDLVAAGHTPGEAAAECLTPEGVVAASRVFSRLAGRRLTGAELAELTEKLPDRAARDRVRALIAPHQTSLGRRMAQLTRARRRLRDARRRVEKPSWADVVGELSPEQVADVDVRRAFADLMRGEQHERLLTRDIVTPFLVDHEPPSAPTAWDALNAITEVARERREPRARFDLERIGALLIRPLVEGHDRAGPTLEDLLAERDGEAGVCLTSTARV